MPGFGLEVGTGTLREKYPSVGSVCRDFLVNVLNTLYYSYASIKGCILWFIRCPPFLRHPRDVAGEQAWLFVFLGSTGSVTFDCLGCRGSGTGCTGKLWVPQPWQCSRPGWMGL